MCVCILFSNMATVGEASRAAYQMLTKQPKLSIYSPLKSIDVCIKTSIDTNISIEYLTAQSSSGV